MQLLQVLSSLVVFVAYTLSSLIVPIMAIVYIGMVFNHFITQYRSNCTMIGTIIKSAFGVQQVTGGAVGVAILQGIKRGLFSNEAGMGSAPISLHLLCPIPLNKV